MSKLSPMHGKFSQMTRYGLAQTIGSRAVMHVKGVASRKSGHSDNLADVENKASLLDSKHEFYMR